MADVIDSCGAFDPQLVGRCCCWLVARLLLLRPSLQAIDTTVNVYGTGVDTERFAFYKRGRCIGAYDARRSCWFGRARGGEKDDELRVVQWTHSPCRQEVSVLSTVSTPGLLFRCRLIDSSAVACSDNAGQAHKPGAGRRSRCRQVSLQSGIHRVVIVVVVVVVLLFGLIQHATIMRTVFA